MKSLFVNGTVLDHSPRGVGVYLAQLLRNWPASGLRVSVQSPVEPPAASVDWIKSPSFSSHIRRLLWLNTPGALQMKGADLVFSPVPEFPVLSGVHPVITLHDLTPLRYPEYVSKKYFFYFRKIIPKLLSRARHIICISESTRDDLISFFPFVSDDRVSVIYNGVDHHSFRPTQEDSPQSLSNTIRETPYLLTVGNLDGHKNLEFLIRSFAAVAEEIPHTLVIIGADERSESSRLMRIAEEVHLERSRLRFTGYISDHDLPAFYANADAFIFPSLYEGFGIPVLEAMACGTPVLAADRSAIPEIAGDAALLRNPTDRDAFSEGIREILRPDTQRSLKEKGIARAGQFSWSKTANETARLLEKLSG